MYSSFANLSAVILFSSFLLSAQEAMPELKRGFAELELGDSVEQSKEKLKNNGYFLYQDDDGINFSRQPEPLLSVAGSGFIKEAHLVFYEEKLSVIELELNLELISYESMFKLLQQNYQAPQQLDQKRIVWQNETTELRLEYPATVKYLDRQALSAMAQAKGEQQQLLAKQRQDFLQQF